MALLKKLWRYWPLALLLAVALLWAFTAPPALPSHAQTVKRWQSSESWIYDRNGVLLESMRVDFRHRRQAWVSMEGLSPALLETLIRAEDQRFYQHGGVDFLAIGNALRARVSGESSRGASTLTMQLAALLAPQLAQPGSRSWWDKIRQARAAWALERGWSKPQIVEAYLNLAGFRGEAQGIGAASLSLFGKPPSALSAQDSAVMVALLPAPNAQSAALGARACRTAPQLSCAVLKGIVFTITSANREAAQDPGLARHLAAKLLKKPGLKVATTLDATVQSIAQIALRRQLARLGPERARDGAVIVVDNESGDILAYIGGAGGDSTAAFVDGADAPRQAGSTLKPFLYAQVMEKGYLAPASILDDSPVQLDTASGLYVPQNYDRAFKGPVSARTALAASLNVPAVRALMLAGTEAFRDRLWDTGYRGLTEDGDYYGFSLALGSAEVTLWEQAAAYRSLARGGLWSPLRLRSDDPREQTRRVVSAEAAWMVGDILADPVARATTFGLESALKLPFWSAAKTGTSKAMRDNWCIGYSDRFTVAVWVGNLEGDSMKAVSGTSGAAPVWRDIMLGLHRDRPGQRPAMPAGVEQQPVRFENQIEPARIDYFLKGMAQPVIALAPAEAQRPRIVNPVSGSIYALDPDIPGVRQRLAISVTGPIADHRLLLDRRDIGAADSRPLIMAPPGAHRLALVNAQGKVVDQVLFTVR